MSDVVTFGEAMVRLVPPHFERLEQTRSLDVQIGGGELNVAVGTSRLGLKSTWVSRLPKNALGRLLENRVRQTGVDTSHLIWSDDGRVGLYFVEFGAAPRPSSVLYDRAHSAISAIRPGEVDWKKVLAGAKWLHTSGITPALSDSAAAVAREALKAARESGATVSYDLNYRAKLWSPEKAQAVQEPLMEFVDVLITTEEDTGVVFKIEAKGTTEARGFKEVTAEPFKDVARRLQEKFRFKAVAITLRENPLVWRNTWTAIAYADGKFYDDVKYELEIVDRIGGGDSFSAGFIYGSLVKKSYEAAVRYGNAFSALKHTIPGDFNWATLQEVETLLKGASLRVAR
ncbi:MAG: sugar kinase [Acidobacteria bacterium]|nr:MAG: sugar kinase [Acidobacteriota bacterium]